MLRPIGEITLWKDVCSKMIKANIYKNIYLTSPNLTISSSLNDDYMHNEFRNIDDMRTSLQKQYKRFTHACIVFDTNSQSSYKHY